MPVTATDFVSLPYDDSLTWAGIEYARQSMHFTYNRMALGPGARLRKIVAGVAAELALVRYLQNQDIAFDRLGSTHYTRKDWYDLGLGGRRVDLKTCFVNQKEKIRCLRRDPAWLLEASALVPADQFDSEALQEGDVYLFAFLAGLETQGPDEWQRALATGRPAYLLHAIPDPAWSRPEHWRALGRLALKSNAAAPLEVEIGGQGRNLEPLAERLGLAPRQRTVAAGEFFSVLYLHAASPPDGEIGLYSPELKALHLVAPHDWANIWVYGLEIVLAGWLTKNEFRQKSKRLRPGSPVKQYDRLRAENWAVPVQELRPVSELLNR